MKRHAAYIMMIGLCCLGSIGFAKDYKVAKTGNDHNPGTRARPFQTIGRAVLVARAGDTVTVHAGIYREWVSPEHSGVVYRAAKNEKVVIKGSEVIAGWKPLGRGAWRVSLPNTFFVESNPYTTLIFGDWFFPWDIARQRIAYVAYSTDSGFKAGIRRLHTGEVYLNGIALCEADSLEQVLQGKPVSFTFGIHEADVNTRLSWYTRQERDSTVIYANFGQADPNKELTEINVRPACFYPRETGVNDITVRGFELAQCASQWAPPTAEQTGCIGTNWSKGWVIENNVIHDSKCVGITLGKDRASGQNPWSADPSKDGSLYYNEMVLRVIRSGWNKAHIGSHTVRNNEVFHCGQAGICGSFGGAFSIIANNDIHDIYTRRNFYGAEMAGIKLHGAIDAVIRNNLVRNTYIGIWLDWMAQVTEVSGNLVYDNDYVDFFAEVNHGPYTVNGNRFLSPFSFKDWSEGGNFKDNTFAGLLSRAPQSRATPVFQPHSTVWVDTLTIRGGHNSFQHNLFLMNNGQPFQKGNNTYLPEDALDSLRSFDLSLYRDPALPVESAGNRFEPGPVTSKYLIIKP